MNDPTAQSLIDESFAYFNMALCNIVNFFTPEAVILGGGFSHAGEYLRQLIEDVIRSKVLIMPEIFISDLKNDASIIGGIHSLISQTDFLKEV